MTQFMPFSRDGRSCCRRTPRAGCLVRLGTVAIDGTKRDANASKIRSMRYDRAGEARRKLATDIAGLTARAEAADAEGQPDPQALPVEIARAEADAARHGYEAIDPRRMMRHEVGRLRRST